LEAAPVLLAYAGDDLLQNLSAAIIIATTEATNVIRQHHHRAVRLPRERHQPLVAEPGNRSPATVQPDGYCQSDLQRLDALRQHELTAGILHDVFPGWCSSAASFQVSTRHLMRLLKRSLHRRQASWSGT
jgi:hypothetical protein